MKPLTPKRLDRVHSLLGLSLSFIALAIGVAMWRHFNAIVPPPPMGVLISSMAWIACGMIGIFYNARSSGLLGGEKQEAPADTESPLGLALQRLRQLQAELDENLITLDEYRQERREIVEAVRQEK
jgi:hypothetical protein